MSFVLELIEAHRNDYVGYPRRNLVEQQPEPDKPPNRLFLIEKTFRAVTQFGFEVFYWMNLSCEEVDATESAKEQTQDPVVLDLMAGDFHEEVFEPHFNERSYFWQLGHRAVSAPGEAYQVFTTIGEVGQEDGATVAREVPSERVKAEMVMKPPYRNRGCEIKLLDFATPPPTAEVIERNYNVLTEEQKKAIFEDDTFGAYGQMLAVASLKHRLDFLKHQKNQKYDADNYYIETESAGRGLKIKWKFKQAVPGYYLCGFRDTGGFSNNQWDENSNGLRVIDSSRDGEVFELLAEGQAYFYTFFLMPYQENATALRCSPLRFQVTIESNHETELIESTIRRIEEKTTPDPGKEHIAKALRELGLYVEFDNAIEATKRSLIDQIQKSSYTEAERQEKIERFSDVVSLVRERYQQ